MLVFHPLHVHILGARGEQLTESLAIVCAQANPIDDICVYIYMYVCMYVYIYMCVYTYVDICDAHLEKQTGISFYTYTADLSTKHGN